MALAGEAARSFPRVILQSGIERRDSHQDLFSGTLAPFSRASERPMAIACLRLFTLPPLPPRPDRSVPCLRLCMARSTLSLAFEPYFRLDLRLPLFLVLRDEDDLRDDDLREDDFREDDLRDDDDFRRAFFLAMITPFPLLAPIVQDVRIGPVIARVTGAMHGHP